MQPIRGSKLRIVLFEGTAKEVMLATDRWLEGQGAMAEVVDIKFNYQGPEYDGSKKLSERGTHGVLIAFRPMSINEVRQHQGYPPLGKDEEAHHATKTTANSKESDYGARQASQASRPAN